MFPNHYPTPPLPPLPPPGYMYTYQQGTPVPGVQHSSGQYVMQSGTQYQHPHGQFIYQYPQQQVVQGQSPSLLQLQRAQDVLPQMPITLSQHHQVTPQVTPSPTVHQPDKHPHLSCLSHCLL